MADAPETPDAPEAPDAQAPDAQATDVAEAAVPEEGSAEPKAPKRPRKAKATAEAGEGASAEGPAVADASAETQAAEPAGEQPVAEVTEPAKSGPVQDSAPDDADVEETPRAKPEVPGAHLEIDIVPEGVDPLGREAPDDPYASVYDEDDEDAATDETDVDAQEAQPIVAAAIDLAAGARYRATGKRKTAVARVILRPGKGSYLINGRPMEEYFPRATLQRNICQPLEAVGYQDRMDVIARMHGGGVSSQAGALRHGISRALLEADPNLRGELKRRGFLTRDSRVKERKKAGLKKARKRPQFSKR